MDRRDLEQLYRQRNNNELYGSWVGESEQERLLRELAEYYHARCDAFDQRVCSAISPRTGEPMPVTWDEHRAVNRHSLDVRKDSMMQGRWRGFTEQQVAEAIRQSSKRCGKLG